MNNNCFGNGIPVNSGIPKTSVTDKAAEVLKEKIVTLSDTVSKNKKCWYISQNGSDSNSGSSPENAWKSTVGYQKHLDEIKPGEAVLFERGGIYRGWVPVLDGVSYGAYGIGDKPKLYGSPDNFADKSYWEKTDMENIWVCNNAGKFDIGTIVFDNGTAVGIKKTHELDQVEKDYDFFHDTVSEKLYLYLTFNPCEKYSDIEFCIGDCILSIGTPVKNVLIENLQISYGGAHGIAFSDNVSDITIRGCVLSWIGGSLQNPTVRFGNAIQFWNTCNNITVEKNYIYQIYDTGFTHQGIPNCEQTNININENLIEYCTYAIEYFPLDKDNGKLANIIYSNNILRFSGYGWGMQRPNPQAVSLICGWGGFLTADNFKIDNNILDGSTAYLIVQYGINDNEIIYNGNSFYMSEGAVARWTNDTPLYAENEEQMSKQVSKIDKSFKEVKFKS